MANRFALVSSEENYDHAYRQYNRKVERRKIEFESPNDEPYNRPFTLQELELAIKTNKKRTAPGPNEVHNNMIRNVSQQARLHMLTIQNAIWTSKHMPEEWNKATIIPILKPEKNKNDPSSYRPISLTSCLSKAF